MRWRNWSPVISARPKGLLTSLRAPGRSLCVWRQKPRYTPSKAMRRALAALDHGFRFASGLRRVTTERRDLFRRPMTFKELNAFDGLVFDPPRAGAEDQSKQIARSDIPYVAAVSCNPVTLARDLAILSLEATACGA